MKKERETLGINPGKIFISTIGVIGSLVSIALAIIYFEILYVIISLLILISIFISVYFIISINQLRKMKDDYNKLVREYNAIKDNRDTLESMVEDKNSEIDSIKSNISHKDSTIALLLWFMYTGKKDNVPNKKELMDALKIQNNQVIKSEE